MKQVLLKKKKKKRRPFVVVCLLFNIPFSIEDFCSREHLTFCVLTRSSLIVFLQEILEEVFRELHKVRDEIIDGMFTSVYRSHLFSLISEENLPLTAGTPRLCTVLTTRWHYSPRIKKKIQNTKYKIKMEPKRR